MHNICYQIEVLDETLEPFSKGKHANRKKYIIVK